VRPAGIFKMVADARCQTSRAEGTADINVKARFEADGAKFADSDRFLSRGVENKGVCAGKWMNTNGIIRTLHALT